VARGWEKLPAELLQPLPRREELESLARHYHRLLDEHARAAALGSTRRRIEERMSDVLHRFERVLVEWVPDEELGRAWFEYLQDPSLEPPEGQRLAARGVRR